MSKQKIYFLGFFLLLPIIFMISAVLWRFIIQDRDLWVVLTDSLGILAIIVSIFFSFKVR